MFFFMYVRVPLNYQAASIIFFTELTSVCLFDEQYDYFSVMIIKNK